MKTILLSVLLVFIPLSVSATDYDLWGFELFSLRKVGFDYGWFFPKARHGDFTSENPPANKLDLIVNTDILTYGFFDGKVISITDADQFRLVGLNYILGVRVTPFLNLRWEHLSEHMLDRAPVPGGFTVYDNVGFTFYLYQREGSGSKSLFLNKP